MSDQEVVTKPVFAWMCQWDGFTQVVWAATIQEARLVARREAGPHAPIKARLATTKEAE